MNCIGVHRPIGLAVQAVYQETFKQEPRVSADNVIKAYARKLWSFPSVFLSKTLPQPMQSK